MLNKNLAFIFFSIFFLAWIFLFNIILSFYFSLLILVFFTLISLVVYLASRKYLYIHITLLIWFLFWSFFWYYSHFNIQDKINLIAPYLDNSKYSVLLEVDSVYKKEEFNNQYIIKVNKIGNSNLNLDISWIISVPSNLILEKWYIVKSKIKLYWIKNFDYFDYKNYLLSKNIYLKWYVNSFDIIETKEQNAYFTYIKKLRNKFLSTINEIYTKYEAIFLWWILVWAREEMPQELKTNFNNSGLTHFIAVSWFNITILIVFFSYIFSYFPILIRIFLISFLVVSFSILVWDTAPVVRATIMWLIWYYIIVSWRTGNSLAIILLTMVIMALYSPLSINYDISLHLSFLAVLWIIYTQWFFSKVFKFLPKILAIKESFVLTFAALTFSLPIIIFNFGQISILSPIANMLVTWSIPLAMLFWFLSIIVYFIFPFVWVIIGYFTWILLKWDMLVVHYFWNAHRAIIEADFWILKNYFEILYFVILIFLVMYFKWNKKE